MGALDSYITEIVEAVAEGFFGMSVRAITVAPESEAASLPDRLTGCVTVAGSWEGAVTVACSRAFARRAAAAMFGRASETLGDEELQDAIGEMANVIGGNYKSLLASMGKEPCHLSIPVVANGSVNVPGATLLHHLWFSLESGLLCVSVLENLERRENEKAKTPELRDEDPSS